MLEVCWQQNKPKPKPNKAKPSFSDLFTAYSPARPGSQELRPQ